ncbi:hypothetical protein HYU82_00800 [Candidatus Saccharibacteria bacterium]|nr:hypothetical protein [Candidatus Saccharibacteria bacterium]
MQETQNQFQPQPPAVAEKPHEGDKVMQDALAARTEGLHELAQARQKLGQVAAGHEVHADMRGNILGPQDLQELRDKGPAPLK